MPAEAAPTATPPATGDFPLRVFVTVVVLGMLYGLDYVPLPGLDTVGLPEQYRGSFGIGLLGVMPWITATLIVEFACLLRLYWRRLRAGGPDERAHLTKATTWVWLVCCAAQGFAIAVSLEGMNTDYGMPFVLEPGQEFRILTVTTLTAGSALWLFGAEVLRARGLGDVFALVFGLRALGGVVEAVKPADFGQFPEHIAPLVITAVAIAWGTARLLRAWTPDGLLPLSGPGTTAVSLGAAILTIIPMLPTSMNAPIWVAELPPWGIALVATQIGGVAGAVYALLQHLPWNVAATTGRSQAEAVAALDRVLPWAIGVTVLGTLFHSTAAYTVYGPALLGLIGPVTLITVAWDLQEEAQARRELGVLVPVWPLHRVYAVPPALAALEAAGIRAHARGLRFRQVMCFFAPYSPIEILVPPARAEEAGRVLTAWLEGTRRAAVEQELERAKAS